MSVKPLRMFLGLALLILVLQTSSPLLLPQVRPVPMNIAEQPIVRYLRPRYVVFNSSTSSVYIRGMELVLSGSDVYQVRVALYNDNGLSFAVVLVTLYASNGTLLSLGLGNAFWLFGGLKVVSVNLFRSTDIEEVDVVYVYVIG